MRHQRCHLWMVAAVATVVLGGCAPSATNDDGHGTVVLGTIADVQSWNPFTSESQFTDWVLALLYPRLAVEQTDYAEHPPTFLPGLAGSWTWSEDRLSLDLELQPGARWSDGTPVTAADVVFSWQAARSDQIGWYPAEVVDLIETVDAVDDTRVRVRFARPDPYAFMKLNETPIVPAHAWAEIPMDTWFDVDWRDHALSCGPFALVAHTPRQQIELGPNPGYWRAGLPRFQRVVWRIVSSKSALVTQLLAGDLDFIAGVTPADAERVRSSSRHRLIEYRDRSYTHVVWNLRRPPLNDRRVRRALAMGVDRDAVISAVYRGWARPSNGPVLSTMWAAKRDLDPPRFDPAEARRLLEEVGWTDHDGDGVRDRDGTPFVVELLVPSGREDRQDAARLIATELDRIGVRIELRFVEWGTVSARLDQGDFDAVINRWVEPTRIDLRGIWHSSPPGATTYNYGGYSNPEVDRLIELVEQATDVAEQQPILDRIQELIVSDQPYLFLVENSRLAGIDRRIDGAIVNDATPYFNLEEWHLGESR